MTFSEFIPPTTILVVYLMYNFAVFEVQRWFRVRQHGMVGSSLVFGEFIDWTFLLNYFLSWGWLIVWAVFISLKQALFILVAGVVTGLLLAILVRDNLVVWMLCLLATWPLFGYLAYSAYQLSTS